MSDRLTVVLPFFNGDSQACCKNLDWMWELEGGKQVDYTCLLAFDLTCDATQVIPRAARNFTKVMTFQYGRAHYQNRVIEDWPWQQNNSFVNTARQIASNKVFRNKPWLWVETDCVPLKPGWIQALETEYFKGGKPFGGHWNPDSHVFNGVAIYPPNAEVRINSAFMAAIQCDQKGRQVPWDAACSKEVYPQLHIMNNVMQHIWCLPETPDKACCFPNMDVVKKWVRPEVYLFHRCKDGSLIDRMREAKDGYVLQQCEGVDIVNPCNPARAKLLEKKKETDIFIVTFSRDAEFTECCLKSIAKFGHGFHEIVVVVPEQDKERFAPMLQLCPNTVLKTFPEFPGRGMLHHMVVECSADLYCSGDIILHVDSDCIFHKPFGPEDYLVNGKPVMVKELFSRLDGPVMNWQTAVENALGFRPDYETMRRHPAAHPRWIYREVRKAVEEHTHWPFTDYVLACKNEFPQTFAEFPTLGAWALRYAPDAHHWLEVGKDPIPEAKLEQFWSKGGLDRPISEGQYGRYKPREIIEKFLA